MTTAVSFGYTRGCVHAPNKTRIIKQLYKEIYQDYFLGGQTFNVIPEYRNVVRRHYASLQSNMGLTESKSRNTQIYGSSVCPKFHRNAPEPVTSNCPHYIVLNVDKQREPKNIAKAKCNCHRCLRIDHNYKPFETTGSCRPVSTFIPVIRWKCPKPYVREQTNNKYYRYVIDIEEVPIGCTCERAAAGRS